MFVYQNIYAYLFQAIRKFLEHRQIPIAQQKAEEYKMLG